MAPPIKNGKYDWNAILPTLDALRKRTQFFARRTPDPSKLYMIEARGGRKVSFLF